MEKYEEIRYHIEVDHEPGTFDNDMDFLSKNPKETYERLKFLKKEYKGHKITITKITETTTHEPLPESALEKLAKSQ